MVRVGCVVVFANELAVRLTVVVELFEIRKLPVCADAAPAVAIAAAIAAATAAIIRIVLRMSITPLTNDFAKVEACGM